MVRSGKVEGQAFEPGSVVLFGGLIAANVAAWASG